ncbi:glutamate--tRNA ligase [Ahrensia sp. R2A130]|uniref:glutamate--tRNA ligase n=1 Tax=Ahrensia sp. R2A130 TaxID=744979 RepID=UPI0001E0E869|nr:glutamate--tRNA ligase [Ahrensia sp. R2A130]EFL90399.1 glutamyl-tRNA synthetase [Ahrensia sp. R2A130]
MTDISTPIVRFAPSPTGRLHVGNIRTALFNKLFALKHGGNFVLRMDDTDTERSTSEFAKGIEEDLLWLGVTWDRMERQSDRTELYDAAASKLREAGLLYACYETADELDRRRKRQMARGLPPVYDRAALKLTDEERAAFEAEGRTAHWRFLLPNHSGDPFETKRTEVHFPDLMRGDQTVDLASMSDPVLVRGDGTYLYTLPSVVDDLDMGVTHVIRGADHIANTGVQIAVMEALGGNAPTFGHHNLLQDASGEGLSKRKGALSIASLRESGLEPMAVASVAALTGTSADVEALSSLTALADVFDPSTVSKSNSRFEPREISALNEQILHQMPYADAQPRLQALGCDEGHVFWETVRANMTVLNDVSDWVPIIREGFDGAIIDDDDRDFLITAAKALPAAPWGDDVWKEWTTALKQETGRKGRGLFMPLRKVLTGLEHGPELAPLLSLIGREETLRRLP